MSQRRIAHLTGQSQSEVCEILKGRRVRDVWVLERIADGLRVPRAWMGLSYGADRPDTPSTGTQRNRVTDGDAAMTRRALVATANAAAMDRTLGGLPEPAPPRDPGLPSRLGMTHVRIVRALTERLRGIARYHGGQAEIFGAAAALYTRWMGVPATEAVTAALAAALAELHTEAGWCRYDAGLDGIGHFDRALRFAGMAKDTYGVANATWHAGMVLVRTRYPNDALKQLGQVQLPRHTDDPRVATLAARLARTSGSAYALMGGHDEATRCLAEASQGWEPRDAFERASADAAAALRRDLSQLDIAEPLAAAAVRAYSQGHYRRGHTIAELLLAEIHIRAGEPHGLRLAHQAIQALTTLHSIAARRHWLTPLARALETRPGTDTQELTRTARRIATTGI